MRKIVNRNRHADYNKDKARTIVHVFKAGSNECMAELFTYEDGGHPMEDIVREAQEEGYAYYEYSGHTISFTRE